jgi:hypothetical protein
MRRDFDLVRKILIEVSKQPAGCSYFSLTYPGEYDDKFVFEHVELLIKDGFIEGEVYRSSDLGLTGVQILQLTWKGQDFLDSMNDDTIWEKAKTTVLKPTVSFTFSLLFEWLKTEAKSKLGIP